VPPGRWLEDASTARRPAHERAVKSVDPVVAGVPFTLVHLGPALLLGGLLPRRLDLPTLVAASVVVDVRAALVVFGPLDLPVHGSLTSFASGTLVAVLLARSVLLLPPSIRRLVDHGRLTDTASGGPVLTAALVGVSSHVVLDSMLYTDARPLYPADWNPFRLEGATFSLEGATFLLVYVGCTLGGILGVAVLAARYWSHPRPE
jgi:hypothetical protein